MERYNGTENILSIDKFNDTKTHEIKTLQNHIIDFENGIFQIEVERDYNLNDEGIVLYNGRNFVFLKVKNKS